MADEAPAEDAVVGPHWLAPEQPPEALWGKVMAASEVEIRWLLKQMGVPFDAKRFAADSGPYRWSIAYNAVRRYHGGDAADALLGLAERMADVWRQYSDLQALMLKCLREGTDTADVLKQFADVAGLPADFFPPDPS